MADVISIIGVQHFLVLAQHRQQIHRHNTAATVFQHLLHRLQRTGRILTVLADFLQIAAQHFEHVHRVVIVIGRHVVFLVLDVGSDVLDQSFRQL